MVAVSSICPNCAEAATVTLTLLALDIIIYSFYLEILECLVYKKRAFLPSSTCNTVPDNISGFWLYDDTSCGYFYIPFFVLIQHTPKGGPCLERLLTLLRCQMRILLHILFLFRFNPRTPKDATKPRRAVYYRFDKYIPNGDYLSI